LNIVGVFAFLLTVEGSAIELLIALFVPLPWLKLAILAMTVGLYFFMLVLLLFPLWTKHRLTDTHLHLRYGLWLNVALPRDAISNAQAAGKSSFRIQPMSARYEAKKQRVTACFSDQGMVLLTLKHPLALKLGWQMCTTTNILFNVDQRDRFLEMLAVDRALRANVPLASVGTRTGASPVPTTHDLVSLSPLMRTGASPVPTDPVRDLASTSGQSWLTEHNLVFPTDVSVATRSGQAQGTAPTIIRIEGLTRRFANFTAVDTLDMTIRAGEIYGFLGSNGAGKSTTIKMLVGLLQPSAGRVWIAGHDVWIEPLAVKKLLGYVADHALLYERLTGREFLDFLAQLRGLPQAVADERITSLLNLLELTAHAERLCGAYSFGMKRKLALAGALLHQPTVLILDEPLNGLDPRSTRRIKDLFLELAAQGKTIVLSTHNLAVAETVCHRVGIFHKGHLTAEGSAAELRQLAAAPDLETVFLSLTSEQGEQEEVSARRGAVLAAQDVSA
jgi:ABC-2 type transport system ATP-binding protein